MNQVLYRKYRPSNFSEVIGQDHVVQTLKGALTMDKVAHAYLFSGPRGTGKTTMARILAKTLNCEKRKDHEPCNKCDACVAINNSQSLDIIEVDGASNRGIEEIRNIKEITRVAAAHSKYKVFIIDEVHSLTKDAFNALLKTLEEPPSHVKFILATTEAHKLLPTVLSRVQRFDFRKISNSLIAKKINDIAGKEKIKIDNDTVRLIAVNSDGSMRDAESSFARLISYSDNGVINLENVKDILGFIPFENYSELLDAIIKKDQTISINLINNYYDTGIDLDNFLGGFLNFLRKIIISKASTDLAETFKEEFTEDQMKKLGDYAKKLETTYLVKVINTFMSAKKEMKTTPIPQLPLELAVSDLTSSEV